MIHPRLLFGCLAGLVVATTCSVAGASLPTGPLVYNVPPDSPPAVLNAGETLNFLSGGLAGYDNMLTLAAGSEFNMYGGFIEFALLTEEGSSANLFEGDSVQSRFSGRVNVHGGAHYDAHMFGAIRVEGGMIGGYLHDAEVEIVGGTVDILEAYDSHVTMSGGAFGLLNLNGGSLVEVSGGVFRDAFIGAGAELALGGGKLSPEFVTEPFTFVGDGLLTIRGTNFSVDGDPLTGLAPGEERFIVERGITINCVFADGTPFEFQIGDPLLTVRVVQSVPEPVGLSLTLFAALLARAPRRRG